MRDRIAPVSRLVLQSRRSGALGEGPHPARELEREALGDFLNDLDHTLGPVPEAELKRVRREWPKR